MSRSSMDSHLFYRLQFLLSQLAFAVCLVSVCRGDIEVTVSSKGAVEGTRVTLSCEYNIVSPASFLSLLWVKLTDDGTTSIAFYSTSVTYYGNYTSGYEMSTDNITTTGTNLTIFSVSERVDNGTYRCDLTVDDSGFKTYPGLGVLTVIQDPCTSSSAPCNNKGNCTIDGLGYSCECVEGYSGPTCETAATTTGIPETSTKLGVTSTEPSGDGTTTEKTAEESACPGWCIGVICGGGGVLIICVVGGGVYCVMKKKEKPHHDSCHEMDVNSRGDCEEEEKSHLDKNDRDLP